MAERYLREARGFSNWVGSKADLDDRIRAARGAAGGDGAKVKPIPPWTLHDCRRLVSTLLHERLLVQPHIVESILGHVGHQAGTPGRYNLSSYRAEKAVALRRWAELVSAIVEGRESKVVALQRA